jgi:hypothetical protein
MNNILLKVEIIIKSGREGYYKADGVITYNKTELLLIEVSGSFKNDNNNKKLSSDYVNVKKANLVIK